MAQQKPLILKGTIIQTPALGQLDILEQGYLIAENGIIVGVFDHLPQKYRNEPVTDYGSGMILQSFSDMHLHAPQYPMLGLGMDLELLDWLNTYTFPTEAKYADPAFARQVYRTLARELVENGTTRVCMFSSLHTEGTLVLMEELEQAGISGFVGKVNMDRNSCPELDESTQESMDATLEWLDKCQAFQNIRPILTPRFSPSCTEELLSFLGNLAGERQLPIQSHLSENRKEIAWVRELFPDCQEYYQSYEKHGLWNDCTLMAHCVWSGEAELQAMLDAGVTVVHCADSNKNVRSGIAPIRKMLDRGISVVLGSDISGGEHLNVFDIVNSTIMSSKLRSVYAAEPERHLSVAEAWFLATSAANRFFGEQPGFAPGNQLNVMVMEDQNLLCAHAMSPKERFERLVYKRQKDALAAVYSGRGLIYRRA